MLELSCCRFFFFQAEDGIRDKLVTGVQTCALPICKGFAHTMAARYLRTLLDWRTRNRRCRSPSFPIASEGSARSEERRVGKECRSRGWPDHEKKKKVSTYNYDCSDVWCCMYCVSAM